MMKHTKIVAFVLSLTFVSAANAVSISSMLEMTNELGEAEFTVTNTEDYRQYITTAISEVSVEKGQLKKTPYTRDNITSWALDVRPARTIVEPGFKKSFRVRYSPQKNDIQRADRDRVFQVSFVPTPYFGEGGPKNTVKIAFGFAPIIIVPAKEAQPIEYELNRVAERIEIKNKGNSYFSLLIDGCDKGLAASERKQCSINATLLAGRHMTLTLPEEMRLVKELKVKLISHGAKFKVESLLTKQG